jgi:hypothetical protein
VEEALLAVGRLANPHGQAVFFQKMLRLSQMRRKLKDYIAFEYSPDVVDDGLKAVRLMEETWRDIGPKCDELYALVRWIDQKLTPQAKKAWRWRVFYLRAMIDSERYRHQGKLEGDTLKKAFDELRQIYHAEKAHSNVRPPVIQ